MNPFLASIYRKDEHSLTILLGEEQLENREAMLREALRVVVGDHVNNRARRGTQDGCSRSKAADECLDDEDKINFGQMLLLAGADPNTRGHCDREPLLFQAVSHGDAGMVQLLLDFACDVNLSDDHGRTCLHAAVASRQNRALMVGLLLASEADPNLQDNVGRTPLAVACSLFAGDADDDDVISMLLIDTKVNLPDYQGKTALHIAVESPNHPRVMQLVLEVDGVNVNAKDNHHLTPLMYAVSLEKTDAVEMLLKKGSDVNARDEAGNTALHTAVEKQAGKVLMSQLIRCGADVNLRNNDGVTPLYAAARAMQAENVLCLLQHNAELPRSYKDGGLKALHLVHQGFAIMAMLILAGHDWDCAKVNYLTPRQFCFCGGPNPPDLSKILVGQMKVNYEQRKQFVDTYGTVKPLKHLCRLQIRKCVGTQIKQKVEELKIPESLKNYILMSELLQVMEIFNG